jgi:Cdc6-like AAA superfamily ATPase
MISRAAMTIRALFRFGSPKKIDQLPLSGVEPTEEIRSAFTSNIALDPDSPINSVHEDGLGRARFAENLAKLIAENARAGLTYGLQGEWGSGKSSLKNLVVGHLRTRRSISVFEFNPWELNSRDQLVEEFFNTLARAVGSSERQLETKARLYEYAAHLLSLGKLATGSFASANADPTFLAVNAGLDAGAKVAAEASLAFRYSTPTLNERRGQLMSKFETIDQQIVIVIDDLDRLFPEEVRLVFQLIKANAAFSNVSFFLLYNRAAVLQAINGSGPLSAQEEFISKIVQVEIDLPSIGQDTLTELITSSIMAAFGDKATSETFSSNRWNAVISSDALSALTNLRQVKRVANRLLFRQMLFTGSSRLRLNVIDLALMEIVHEIDQSTYHSLKSQKAAICCDVLLQEGRVTSEEFTRLKSRQKNFFLEKEALTKQLLSMLFPYMSTEISNSVQVWPAEWLLDARICHPGCFDAYFASDLEKLGVDSDIIDQFESVEHSQKGIEEFLSISTDLDRLDKVLKTLAALYDPQSQRVRDRVLDALCVLAEALDLDARKTARILDQVRALAARLLVVRSPGEEIEPRFRRRNYLELGGVNSSPGNAQYDEDEDEDDDDRELSELEEPVFDRWEFYSSQESLPSFEEYSNKTKSHDGEFAVKAPFSGSGPAPLKIHPIISEQLGEISDCIKPLLASICRTGCVRLAMVMVEWHLELCKNAPTEAALGSPIRPPLRDQSICDLEAVVLQSLRGIISHVNSGLLAQLGQPLAYLKFGLRWGDYEQFLSFGSKFAVNRIIPLIREAVENNSTLEDGSSRNPKLNTLEELASFLHPKEIMMEVDFLVETSNSFDLGEYQFVADRLEALYNKYHIQGRRDEAGRLREQIDRAPNPSDFSWQPQIGPDSPSS